MVSMCGSQYSVTEVFSVRPAATKSIVVYMSSAEQPEVKLMTVK